MRYAKFLPRVIVVVALLLTLAGTILIVECG